MKHEWNITRPKEDMVIRNCDKCGLTEVAHLVCSSCGHTMEYQIENNYRWQMLSQGDDACDLVKVESFHWSVSSGGTAIFKEEIDD